MLENLIMNKQICIVDYGIGNLLSIQRAIEKLGFQAVVTNDANFILNSTHIILPGVGAFGKAMESIKKLKLDKILNECSKNNKFILGICLGMQLLCSRSEEFEINNGLNLIPGRVIPLKSIVDKRKIKIPNIGWLNIKKNINGKTSKIDENINQHESFYFIHSFTAVTDSKYQISSSYYCGVEFQAIINKGNIYGVQFHPEKSGESGLKLLNNFVNL